MHPAEDSPYQLLVEGPDDQHSVIHLLARHGFDWEGDQAPRPYVRNEGGVPGVLKVLPLLLKGTYLRVGCVVDANAAITARWAQLQGQARSAGVRLPDAPEPGGTIVEGRMPGGRVRVWLMPDNKASGTLEDFLCGLIPEDDAPWVFSEEVVLGARRRGAPCLPKDHLKSRLHTWLAWQETPGLPFGTALKAQVLRSDSELAVRFVDWFRRLFGE